MVGPRESSSQHSRFQNGNNTKIVTKTKGKKKGEGAGRRGRLVNKATGGNALGDSMLGHFKRNKKQDRFRGNMECGKRRSHI